MRIGDWEVHPAAVMLPELRGAEFEALCSSIRDRGLLEPLVLWAGDGSLLDGRNRLRACLQLGVAPRFERCATDEPWEWVWSRNIERRHLEPGQRAALRMAFDSAILEYGQAAAARQRAALQRGRPANAPASDPDDSAPVVATLPPREKQPKTREVLAKLAKCDPRTAQKAITLYKESPELLAQVCVGDVSLDRAVRMARTAANPEWNDHEVYYSPSWVVDLLLDAGVLPLDAAVAVEPCVGSGAIVRAFQSRGLLLDWVTMDVREVEPVHDGLHVTSSWLDPRLSAAVTKKLLGKLRRAKLVITNPPFSLAQQVVERAWELCPDAFVWILQRRTWHDAARAEWFQRHQPDELNICPRVRFVRPDGREVGDGTDNTIHTWYGFAPGRQQPAPGPQGGVSRTLMKGCVNAARERRARSHP